MRIRWPSCVAVLRNRFSMSPGLVGPPAHHIEQPVSAILIAAELDADGPIGVVELSFFGRGEIPITDDIEVRRNLVDDGTPLRLEIEPGRRPDLPIAT